MLGKVIAMGLGVMFLTTMIHALFMVGVMQTARWHLSRFGRVSREVRKAALVASLSASMFLAIVIEAWLWAIVYLYNPLITELPDMETAFYFSMVTFTTLGYGDVVLAGHWRTLTSIQAANGVIIFGWTTALIFYLIQKIYRKE
jgi:hypothetical protein